MPARRLTLFVTTLAVAAACTTRDVPADAARATTSPDSGPSPEVPWFDGVAPILLAPAHAPDKALLVVADSLAEDPEDGSLPDPGSLVKLDGSVVPVRVALVAESDGCVAATVQPSPGGAWGVGFVGRAPLGIPVDTLGAISQSDSVALTRSVFRLASAVPNAPGGRFAGLPFSLVSLWRLRLPDGALVVVAVTRRQINQEDSPLEERTLLIAEGDSVGDLATVHSSRATGVEETVEGSELLAAVTFPGRSDLQLTFAHDYGDEAAYSIIERTRRGSWTRRWASRRFSC